VIALAFEVRVHQGDGKTCPAMIGEWLEVAVDAASLPATGRRPRQPIGVWDNS